MATTQSGSAAVSEAWSTRMADSTIARFDLLAEEWNYQWGLVLLGFERVWRATGNCKYFDYIKSNIDHFVQPDGTIHGYRIDEYNVDRLNTGKVLFPLYAETGENKYKIALDQMRRQLETHPRTPSRGFWHKQIYPNQMWLDGIYMADAFYAQYAHAFGEPIAFDDIAYQVILIEQHTRDDKTGLLYHAWDESNKYPWSNPVTGCSSYFWGRAMGWYGMAIVDILDYMPADYPQRDALIAILNRMCDAIVQVRDPKSGVWYQILDQGTRAGNYLEASGSCMFVYAMHKGSRKGYLPKGFRTIAQDAYEGILKQFVEVDANGQVHINKVCKSAGLGGTPYRDGSYEYYIGEPIVTDNHHGVGAFILASAEIETQNS